MWVVKFRPDHGEPAVTIYAEDVDMMNMPLIFIKGIRPKYRSPLIKLPDDEVFDELVECDPLVITYMNLVHVGKLKDPSSVVSLGVHSGEKAEARS